MRIGVLALQGDFREHIAMLRGLDVDATEVRSADELGGIDAVVIPGGESTTIGKLAVRYGLVEPLRAQIRDGLPAYGTCAGMIFLASGTTGEIQDQLGALDVVVERNAFGRQIESFEEDLQIDGLSDRFRAVYIRAPWIHKVGADVDVLATSRDHPVMVRQGHILATSFHPELTTDNRLHTMFVELVREI